MFFLILSASYFVMRIYVTILKGVSQQKDNGEPLTKKKKGSKCNPSIMSHWPKCAFQTPDQSSNLYCQNIQG